MLIDVMSRAEALKYPFVMGDFLIAIRADSVPQGEYARDVFVEHLVFADDDHSMTDDHARRILRQANRCLAIGSRLFVHCDAGISRSAGVAEALHRLGEYEWHRRDERVWRMGGGRMPRYEPNAHVVSTILRVATKETRNVEGI